MCEQGAASITVDRCTQELRQSDIFSCSRRSRSDNKKGRPVWVALAAWHMCPNYGLFGIPRDEGCNASEQRPATKAVLARVDRCGSSRIDLGCRVWCGHEHQDGPICRCAGQGTSPFTLLQGVNREFFVRSAPAVLGRREESWRRRSDRAAARSR